MQGPPYSIMSHAILYYIIKFACLERFYSAHIATFERSFILEEAKYYVSVLFYRDFNKVKVCFLVILTFHTSGHLEVVCH